MTDQHPITPPPELRRQWLDNDDFPFVAGTNNLLSITKDRLNSVMDQAARWGADQELEACCEYMQHVGFPGIATILRVARRPKLPSLKRVALLQLDTLNADLGLEGKGVDLSQTRRALEALDD